MLIINCNLMLYNDHQTQFLAYLLSPHCSGFSYSSGTFSYLIKSNCYPLHLSSANSQFPVTCNWELQPFTPSFNYFNNLSDNFIFDIIFSKPLLANRFCCLSALIYKTIETITFSFSKHLICKPMHSTFYSLLNFSYLSFTFFTFQQRFV